MVQSEFTVVCKAAVTYQSTVTLTIKADSSYEATEKANEMLQDHREELDWEPNPKQKPDVDYEEVVSVEEHEYEKEKHDDA